MFKEDPLIVAIFNNNLTEVNRLLDLGTNVNYHYKPDTKNPDGELTPLQFAASMGNVEIIQALLDKAADPLAVSQFGRSALSIAAYSGHLNACKLLLPVSDILSTDITTVEAYRNARRGKIYTGLEDKKINCQAVLDFLLIPTYIEALRANHTRLIKELEKEEIDYAGVFVSACIDGDLELVTKMLRHRKCADINAYYEGITGLHAACENGHGHIVYELLSHKELNVNLPSTRVHKNITGYTALHYVCQYMECSKETKSIEYNEQNIRVDIAEALLNHGANINSGNSDGLFPIHIAIIFNHLELVKLFTLRGVNLKVIIKYPDEIVKKHMPNTDSLYGDLLTFSNNRPEINKYLREVMEGKLNFGRREFIGGCYRFNYNHPLVKVRPPRFDENDFALSKFEEKDLTTLNLR